MTESWHVIEEKKLLEALRLASNGADPDVLLLEMVANADVEHIDPEDE